MLVVKTTNRVRCAKCRSRSKVVVAKVGAVMPSGMVIKDAELRGVASSGMICSMRELNLPNAPQEKESWYCLMIIK